MTTKTDTIITRVADFELLESRADGDGLTLEGYAAVFNSPTTIDSWEGKFVESIAPGAFKRTIAARTPVLQFDHGQHPMIGGLPIGVIRSLKEDAHGLHVKARLSDNWLVEPVRDAIRDQAVQGMSFRFVVRDDEWTEDNTRRVIREVELRELGPVVFPAYNETSVGVRSAHPALAELVAMLQASPEVREGLATLLYADRPSNPEEDLETEDPGTSDDHAPDAGDPSEGRADDETNDTADEADVEEVSPVDDLTPTAKETYRLARRERARTLLEDVDARWGRISRES
jgi:HK97 family phage prohead protease